MRTHKENEDQFNRLQGRGLFPIDDKQNRDTIPMPTFAGRPSTMSSKNTGGVSAEFYGWTAKTQSFLVWKIRFKNQVTTCSDFPSEAMLWIKEVEMVDSLEELKSSRSFSGKNFPYF